MLDHIVAVVASFGGAATVGQIIAALADDGIAASTADVKTQIGLLLASGHVSYDDTSETVQLFAAPEAFLPVPGAEVPADVVNGLDALFSQPVSEDAGKVFAQRVRADGLSAGDVAVAAYVLQYLAIRATVFNHDGRLRPPLTRAIRLMEHLRTALETA